VRLARAAGVTPPQALVAADPAKRVRELEAEVARLKMEREILKKAAAFFARGAVERGFPHGSGRAVDGPSTPSLRSISR
jgi:transposase-like protein